MAEIIVMFGDSTEGKFIFNKGTMVAGRARDSDIVLDNLAVSRKHARFSCDGDRFFITDLNSGNGTYVNGEEIRSTELRDNDQIVIGKHTLIFRNPMADQALRSDVFGGERTVLVPKARVAYLVVVEGKEVDREYRIEKPKVTIGRDPGCDVTISDWRIAKEHAIVYRQGEEFLLRNSAKWHGLKVNGQPATETSLREGDVVQLGSTKLMFGISSEELPTGR